MNRIPRWRAPRIIGATLLLAVLLGGCIEIRIESAFEDDLSALHALQTTIEREGLDQLAAMGGEETDPFEDTEEVEAEAREAGLDFERIDTDEHVGWRVSKQVDDSSDVGAALNEIFADSDPEADSVDTFSGSIVRDGDTYRLDLTVNSTDVFEDQEGEADDLGMDPSELFSFIYVVTMPGEVTETNGTRVGDNQVQWDLPITGTTTLTAVSEAAGAGGGSSMIVIIAVIAALVLAGLAAFFLMQRRRQPAPLGAAPAPGVAPADPYSGMPASEPVVTGTGEILPPVEPEPRVDPDPATDPNDDTRQLPRP
ncbi:MAG TPA: hypothetical protein VMM78_08260 [Thermomicrobiales bacterium]|nr:hypothetical protein [Thermomicrobiales bacterium]